MFHLTQQVFKLMKKP